MKKILLVATLLICSLVIAPRVSANSGDNHDDHHDFGQSFKNFFDNKKHQFDNFVHHNDKKNHDDGDDNENDQGGPSNNNNNGEDPSDHCDGDADEDDAGCDVSAPEFSGLTAPITFALSGIGLVIAKKRMLI